MTIKPINSRYFLRLKFSTDALKFVCSKNVLFYDFLIDLIICKQFILWYYQKLNVVSKTRGQFKSKNQETLIFNIMSVVYEILQKINASLVTKIL